MKKTVLFLMSLLTVVSCYDDTRLWEELQKHEERIAALEALCSQMNTNITSMQAVVTALQTNDVITAVTPITEGDEIVGYTITFSKSDPITIHLGKNGENGSDGSDGSDGKDGVTPVIGVRQDADGIYYWTLNGDWMLDEDGNKVRATGEAGKDGEDGEDGKDGEAGEGGTDAVTPMLKIEDGWWYVSYNNGTDWQKLGKATGTDGDSFFLNVSQDEKYVYFTLSDGTVITIAKKTEAEDGDGEGDDEEQPSQTQTKGPMTLSLGEVTATTVTFSATLDVDMMADYQEVGLIYSQSDDLDVENEDMNIIRINKESYEETFTSLPYDTDFHYTLYLLKNNVYSYGETKSFRTKDVTIDVDNVAVTNTTVTFTGKVDRDERDSEVKVGIQYSETNEFLSDNIVQMEATPEEDGSYSIKFSSLYVDKSYFYRTYVQQGKNYEYGDADEFTTTSIEVELTLGEVTQTTASFTGTIDPAKAVDEVEFGILCSTNQDISISRYDKRIVVTSADAAGNYSAEFTNLKFATTYNYVYYIKNKGKYSYSEVNTFTTEDVPVTVSVSSVTQTTATFVGEIDLTEQDLIEVGLLVSENSASLKIGNESAQQLVFVDVNGNNSDEIVVERLQPGRKYYYSHYIKQGGDVKYSEVCEFTTLIPDISSGHDLSADESANCYVVSSSGQYKFKAVKGNGSESIINGSYADVLWESFGTSVAPMKADLISWVMYYADGYIGFEIPSDYKEGNAVIAVMDVSGNILWSWHIWLTDRPESQTYYVYDYDTDSFTEEVAGIMMDRNLGATSATKGDVGALGLLYQWGRKDPFLGSSSISAKIISASTIEWPSSVNSRAETGTIEYAVSHPTTFIDSNYSNYDWYYTGTENTDNTRWTTSESEKSIYDPCPAGWRVPDGGDEGIWYKSGFIDTDYDYTNEGISFINNDLKLWYPAAGCRSENGGSLSLVGSFGLYWSATPDGFNAYYLYFDDDGYVSPSFGEDRALGYSVRCLQE